jgi:hypothetical protein
MSTTASRDRPPGDMIGSRLRRRMGQISRLRIRIETMSTNIQTDFIASGGQ